MKLSTQDVRQWRDEIINGQLQQPAAIGARLLALCDAYLHQPHDFFRPPQQQPLSLREKQLKQAIVAYEERHGVPPSYENLRVDLGLKSKAGIANLVESMIRKGHLMKQIGRKRCLQVIP